MKKQDNVKFWWGQGATLNLDQNAWKTLNVFYQQGREEVRKITAPLQLVPHPTVAIVLVALAKHLWELALLITTKNASLDHVTTTMR